MICLSPPGREKGRRVCGLCGKDGGDKEKPKRYIALYIAPLHMLPIPFFPCWAIPIRMQSYRAWDRLN